MSNSKGSWFKVNRVFAIITSIAIALMGLFTTADVIWRWFTGEPIGPVFSICETLMAIMVFASLAPTQEAKGHINVTILTMRLSKKWKSILNLIGLLVCLTFFALMCYMTIQDGMWAYKVKSFRAGDFYRFPTWWARMFVPVGILAMIGQLVVEIKTELKGLFLLKDGLEEDLSAQNISENV